MLTIEANGAAIPAIGLGTWELRERTCARVVEQALRLGYRHIDTAQMYDNERWLVMADDLLERNSWASIWGEMERLLDAAVALRRSMAEVV